VVPTTVTDLGPNNNGDFGPTDATNKAELYQKAAKDSYHRPATNHWICVDGRGVEDEKTELNGGVDPQIPGSLPITDTAADLLDPKNVGKLKLSERIAENTTSAIKRGKTVGMHGDVVLGKNGCAANAKMRSTLSYAADNINDIVLTVWSLVEAYGLVKLGVTQDDVVESILAGGKAAKDDATWDATPEEVTGIALQHGATFATVVGDHKERMVGIEMDAKNAFDNRTFAADHPDVHGKEQQAFAVALGKYIHDTVAERIGGGEDPRDAGLHTMRAIIYTIALTKNITNSRMEALLFGAIDPITVG